MATSNLPTPTLNADTQVEAPIETIELVAEGSCCGGSSCCGSKG